MIQTMKTIFTAFLSLTLTFLSAQNLEQYIPKDATIVMTMNLNHLNKKVNLLELQQYPFYDMMVQQMSMGGGEDAKMMENFMTEPSKLGLNVMEKAYFFAKMDASTYRYGMIAQLADKQAFVNTLKTAEDLQKLDIQEINGFSYIIPEDDMTIAWNDKMMMIGSVEKQYVYEEEDDFSYEEYETEEEYTEEEMPIFEELPIGEEEEIVEMEMEMEEMPESLEEVTEEMLEAPVEMPEPDYDFSQFLPKPDPELRQMTMDWVSENLTLATDNSITTNSRFSKAASQNDMHFWLDYSYLMEQMQNQPNNYGFGDMEDMMGQEMIKTLMNSLYKDNFVSMGMNFDDGRWVFGIDQYSNPAMMKLMDGTFDSKYHKKMSKFIRGDELMGIYHVNVNMDKMVTGYKDLLKNMAGDVPIYGGMAESALEILGIFIDEQGISNIFNGDMIFATTGMQSVTKMETVVEYDDDFNPTDVEREVTKDLPEITFMMSYGNEKDILKFVRLGVKTGVLQQNGQNFSLSIPDMDGMDATLALRDGILFISNSQDLINKNFNKKYKGKQKINKQLRKTMCKHAQVMYFDIPQMIASLKAEEMAGAMGAGDFVNVSKQNFESMLLTTDKELKNGAYHSEFSLNLTKKDANALKQLFEIINETFMAAMDGGSKT